jgi:hypothetical protein
VISQVSKYASWQSVFRNMRQTLVKTLMFIIRQITKPLHRMLCGSVAWCALHRLSGKALLLLLGLGLLFTGAFWKFAQNSRATGVPDTPDAKAIAAVLRQFYALLDAAVETTVDQAFAAVVLDRPDPPLTDGQQELLIKVLGEENAPYTGYLTYILTERHEIQHGEQLAKAAKQKAKTENREITGDEWAAIQQQNYGLLPSGPDPRLPKTMVSLESIKFSGDQAIVRYNTDPAYEVATLLKVNGRWYIIGIRVIWAHF